MLKRALARVVQGLHKLTTLYVVLYLGQVMEVNRDVCAKSGSCWKCLVGGRSTQGLFCIISLVLGISFIKTWWSLNTGTANGRFYCISIKY